jgi:hypothetical protein
MFDYSVFDKPKEKVFDSNPRIFKKRMYKNDNPCDKTSDKKPHDDRVQLRIKIRLYEQDYKMISIYNNESLEDLYIKIYNAVYPEFSTENNWDVIPPPGGFGKVPRLYYVSVFNAKEEFMMVPVHKFISLSSFMQANPSYFNSISIIGPPMYNIYAIDEKSLEKINNKSENTSKNYYQKFISCISN